ncbi:hypothetical protein ANN_21648 [Periplaneta americana]|uniref:Reverse transcriptase n=1 Tax=Periplaneta americana TaxID=6978 RepID=A0ABQ8S612_PERAM|nr:hypothetical protein ANN_21648 [Periplaneta americana]
MIMSRDGNIVRNGNINIGDLSFEEVEKFKYLGATVTNVNDTREEIKRRINMGNACYYSVEKLLSSSLLSKNLKVRIYKTVILPLNLVSYCKTSETYNINCFVRDRAYLLVFRTEPIRGKSVILYKEFTPANKWIRQPDRLTSSEWRQALKMTANVCPLRAIPGRSRDGKHCRRCVSEIETLGHVLGACRFSETLRNSRHHRIRSMIAEALRKKGLTVHEEVRGISQEGSCRRIDMLAIPPGSTSAYIIDPTGSRYRNNSPLTSTEKNAEFMSPQ